MIKANYIIADYRKKRPGQAPILIDGAESFKFLGVQVTNKLTWSKHTKTVVKRAQQNLFPLRRLKRFGMGPQILQWVVRASQYITGAKLPAIQYLYTRWCQRKALKIVRLQPP